MRCTLLIATSCLAAVQFSFVFAQDSQPEQAAAESAPTREANGEDLSAIRAAINSYVTAFNKGDAKALAAHWTESGEFATPDGETLVGRQQLEKSFAAYFTDTPEARIELLETTVEILSPSVALENGVARVLVPEQEPSETEYEAIHVKTGAGWKIDRVSEVAPPAAPPTHYEQLSKLEWMVGTWKNADDEAEIETTCRWTTNQNFLVRTFKVFSEGSVEFEGTQVVGWDPYAGTIRSWLFDSDGGFGVGRWSQGDGRWNVATLNVLPDGRRGSSTNVYELVDENTVRFSSIGRQVDGELLPSIEPVTIVRAQSE